MRGLMRVLLIGLTVVAVMFDPVAAQGRGGGRGEGQARSGGPAFCRSGAGHPVYGRAWCVEKGFALGAQDWRRVDMGRIAFRKHTRGDVDRGGLVEILGEVSFGKLEARIGVRVDSPLTGHWLTSPDGPSVLQIRAGSTALGELVDNDRDGTVDVVLMRFGK